MRGWIDTVLKKIFLLISRGRLLNIDNSKADVQTIQVSNLADEVITDIERYQEYGFENYPIISNAEAITLFVNGNRNANKGINIVVNNRALRPTDLQKGDVCIYCKDSNSLNQNRIWLKPTNNEIEIKTADNNDIVIDKNGIEITDSNTNKVVLKSTGIEVTDKNNNKYEMTTTGTKLTDKNNNIIETKSTGVEVTDANLNTIKMNGVTVDINGNTKKFVTYTELNTAITLFLVALMAHVHTSAAPGAPTSTPTAPITFDISAAESQKARTG